MALHSNRNGATVDPTYPSRWNVITRKQRNSLWSEERFACIHTGSNSRLPYNATQLPYADASGINNHSSQHHINTSLHSMQTRSTPHWTHDHHTNNIGSFHDDALYGSNWIVDDAVIEAGTIYTNDCSDYLQHMEHKIENHNTYYNRYSDTEEDEMDDYDLMDSDEYLPTLVNKFDMPQKPKHVQSSPETQDVSERESDRCVTVVLKLFF
eukprot:12482_1